jgi:uncharacterized protein GlcG (DUF336 family)
MKVVIFSGEKTNLPSIKTTPPKIYYLKQQQPCTRQKKPLNFCSLKNLQKSKFGLMIDLTLELADTVARAALAKARELGVAITVSVVDESGRLVLCMRGNGLSFLTPEFARGKAVAAIAFRKSTEELAISREKFPAFWDTVPSISSEPLLPAKGGVPLILNGNIIGAVGCSGASSDEDRDCAIAGASQLSS